MATPSAQVVQLLSNLQTQIATYEAAQADLEAFISTIWNEISGVEKLIQDTFDVYATRDATYNSRFLTQLCHVDSESRVSRCSWYVFQHHFYSQAGMPLFQ